MKRVLVANRGEIACRVIGALQDLGIEAVAIYSVADKEALHVQLADKAICIGGASVQDSYLNISRIIAAAEISGAEGIHPGYGFLSENADFAEIVEKSGLIFIGPSSDLIRSLGNKVEAKKAARAAGCPAIPGTVDKVCSVDEALLQAKEIGFPLLVKAASGGGGKGIRLVEKAEEFEAAFYAAQKEAMLCYGDDAIYLEKKIVSPKHVEVQVIGDGYGNVIHLYERDCTLQRRRQKLIEEAPSLAIHKSKQEEICRAAVALCKKVGYFSLATVEFLLEEDGSFYFMEVNTRVQVEHTITEELFGVDLVAMQIGVALGKKLPITQEQVEKKCGHVMQFRINAENPSLHFRPSPGLITHFVPPLGAHIRFDSAAFSGSYISPYYDSMIAKLIVRGDSREEVIVRAKRALQAFQIEGIDSTIPFHIAMLEDKEFVENRHNITTIDSRQEVKV
ncbi:acetyl-CoA carboxylase biotin carboxylase subunit [bacterium]|nr:acetyl-CoA carboxylase biotin carboxylase subunit [bacterium]